MPYGSLRLSSRLSHNTRGLLPPLSKPATWVFREVFGCPEKRHTQPPPRPSFLSAPSSQPNGEPQPPNAPPQPQTPRLRHSSSSHSQPGTQPAFSCRLTQSAALAARLTNQLGTLQPGTFLAQSRASKPPGPIPAAQKRLNPEAQSLDEPSSLRSTQKARSNSSRKPRLQNPKSDEPSKPRQWPKPNGPGSLKAPAQPSGKYRPPGPVTQLTAQKPKQPKPSGW